MIYPEYLERIRAIKVKTHAALKEEAGDNPGLLKELIAEDIKSRNQEYLITQEFNKALAEEYNVPKEIHPLLWDLAWEQGRELGYASVEERYQDISDLVRDVLSVVCKCKGRYV